MDFEYTREEEAFRQEVRDFLDENLVARNERGSDFLQKWLTGVRAKRWVGFSWPVDVGGGGGNLTQQAILKEEMALRGAPPLGISFMGLSWVGPPPLPRTAAVAEVTRIVPLPRSCISGHTADASRNSPNVPMRQPISKAL